ncbi:MAG: aspartate ammonia-lyase [Sphingomonadaceae bacterium]|jgi:aspartate ammonia-lyase|nr:aspartate ammonia-lyase [Sphingomonadaceae bacterium]
MTHNLNDRLESDSLGAIAVPTAALYGPQTARAVENFRITGRSVGAIPDLVRSMAWVKKAAAIVNMRSGELPTDVANAIVAACDEIISGKFHEEFVVDQFQGGAGTSTNMNANEVIANRAIEHLGGSRGDYRLVHPIDHVNRSQSTNDAYATAVRLAACTMVEELLPAIKLVVVEFRHKASQYADVRKLARTQLQDAVPIMAGMEFEAYAETLLEDIERLREMQRHLLEVNLGGTAVGTGVGARAAYRATIVQVLEEVSGLPVRNPLNPIEATADMGAFVTLSGLLKRHAVKLSKICNDLRLLSSGPIGGIGEVVLPARQAGSSIMPGKVNPVIPEAVNQVCFKVIGNDLAITFAAEAGQLQLNAFEPMIIQSLHESISLLRAALTTLGTACIRDLEVDERRCLEHLSRSTALAVLLAQYVGYDEAARLAKEALAAGEPFVSYLRETAASKPGVSDFLSTDVARV